jgi:hypothetical protein
MLVVLAFLLGPVHLSPAGIIVLNGVLCQFRSVY